MAVTVTVNPAGIIIVEPQFGREPISQVEPVDQFPLATAVNVAARKVVIHPKTRNIREKVISLFIRVPKYFVLGFLFLPNS